MLYRRFCRLTVFASLLLASVAVAQDTAVETAPQAKQNTAIQPVPRGGGWMKRHESFNARVKEGNVDLLMIGDSGPKPWNPW